MSSTSQKGKEKVCGKIVACPFKDPIKSTIDEPKKKKFKTSKWEINRVYQNKWVVRFIWYELVCEGNGNMRMVRCKVCSNIERRDKLLFLKLDYLIKHVDWKKWSVVRLGGTIGPNNVNPNNAHVKTKVVYFHKAWHGCWSCWEGDENKEEENFVY